MNKLMYIALVAMPFSAMSHHKDPDSVVLNSNMDIKLSHNVNGSFSNKSKLIDVIYGVWGYWETINNLGKCTEWSPDVSTKNLGSKFIQERYCDAEQSRERKVSHHYSDGSVITKVEHETKVVSEEIDEERSAIGTKNYIVKELREEKTFDSEPYECGSYQPSPSTINMGVKFKQTQSCSAYRTKIINTYNLWANGDKTLKDSKETITDVDIYYYKTGIGTKVKDLKWVLTKRGKIWEMPHCIGYKPSVEGKSCKNEGSKVKEMKFLGHHSGLQVCGYMYLYLECK